MKLITKEAYLLKTNDYLNRLYSIGLTQILISSYLGVTDRAIRKWEYFQSVPSGVQFINLKRLCNELGA